MQTNNQCQEHLTFYSPNTKLCSISNLGWSFDKSKQRANSLFIYLFWHKIIKKGSLALCLFNNYGPSCSKIIANLMYEKDSVQDCSCELWEMSFNAILDDNMFVIMNMGFRYDTRNRAKNLPRSVCRGEMKGWRILFLGCETGRVWVL